MKKYFICFCLLLTLQTPFAQDLHLDAKNGTIPEDIARIIDESWVLFQSEEESEARGALAVNLLPLLRQYYANSRVYFFMLMEAAGYYQDIEDFESAANCMKEFFHRMSNSDMTFEKLGSVLTLRAYSLYARSLMSINDYEAAAEVSKTGLRLSHTLGDSLEYQVIEFAGLLVSAYGEPWSPIKNDEKYYQYFDTCVHYLPLQDLSRPNLSEFVSMHVYLLAAICYARKEMDKAIEVMESYLHLLDFDNATIEDLGLLNGWIFLCSQSGRYEEVLRYAPLTMKLYAEELIMYNSAFSESSRQLKSDENDVFFESIINCAANYEFGAVLGDIYNHLLFRKNLLLRTTQNISDALQNVEDKRIRRYFEDYRFTCMKLDSEKQSKHPNQELLDSLSDRVEALDRMLTYYAYQNKIDEPAPTWQDIQGRLSDKAVAVEYYSFVHYLGDQFEGEYYVAFVVTKTCEHPYMVLLFPRSDLPDMSFGTGYQQKVFGKIEPYLHPGDTIYFSAHGAFHRMSMETMLLPDKFWVCDKYVPVRLTTTAQLVHPSKSYDKSAVLYGGLSYNLTPKTMRREAWLASGIRAGVNPLPYTKSEIEKIGKKLKQHGYDVTLLSGSKGNEESFKALHGHSPAIIHLATHGFYTDEFFEDALDPMLHTGLLLSGANAKVFMNEDIDYEDGILTALEISRLDLRGTELVVLSACETGVGDITADGVWGLQRAFKIAGAETLILSLWEIEEKPTEQFMTIFYHEYLRDHNKIRAFRMAQDAIRKAYPYDSHWAAFIMLD